MLGIIGGDQTEGKFNELEIVYYKQCPTSGAGYTRDDGVNL